MPRLDELQRMSASTISMRHNRHEQLGEETLVVDERSCRSSASWVEEKLTRLTTKGAGKGFSINPRV